MRPLEETERHVEKESPINKVVAIVVAILSAALLTWAGYHVWITASAERRQEASRNPETEEQLQHGREALEKEERDKAELESAQSIMREREAAGQGEQIRFGQ